MTVVVTQNNITSPNADVTALTVGTANGLNFPNAGPLSNRNLIYNGAMQVWQRGTSTASVTTNNYFSADRFRNVASSAGTWTLSKSTEVPTGQGFAASLKYDCTTANAALGTSNLLSLEQRFEGHDMQSLKKGTANAESLTLSFWVRSNKTGTYIAELRDDDNNRTIAKSYTINASNTWEKKVLTFPGDTTGALDNDNALSFYVNLWLAAGTDYSSGTLATSWGTRVNANRAVGQVNLADSTSNEWYITGVQLEVGSVATPFEHRSYGDELARCQRYFERRNINDNGNTDGVFGIGNALSSSTLQLLYYWNTTKRSSASITLTLDGGVIYVRNATGNSQGTTQSFTVTTISSNHALLTFTANGGTFTSGGVGQVRVDQTGSGNAYFSISAEL